MNVDDARYQGNLRLLQRAAMPEGRTVRDIISNAMFVVLYEFDNGSGSASTAGQWKKCGVEGPMFVATSIPTSSVQSQQQDQQQQQQVQFHLIVTNRLATENFVRTLTATWSFEQQPPFLIARPNNLENDGKPLHLPCQQIWGIWFPNMEELQSVHTVLKATVEGLFMRLGSSSTTTGSPSRTISTSATTTATNNNSTTTGTTLLHSGGSGVAAATTTDSSRVATTATGATSSSSTTTNPGTTSNMDAVNAAAAALSLKTVLGIVDTSPAPTSAAPASSHPSSQESLPPGRSLQQHRNNNNSPSLAVAPAAVHPSTTPSITVAGASPTVASPAVSTTPLVLDKTALQLSLLSLLQDDRFLDLLHAQYIRVLRNSHGAAASRRQTTGNATDTTGHDTTGTAAAAAAAAPNSSGGGGSGSATATSGTNVMTPPRPTRQAPP